MFLKIFLTLVLLFLVYSIKKVFDLAQTREIIEEKIKIMSTPPKPQIFKPLFYVQPPKAFDVTSSKTNLVSSLKSEKFEYQTNEYDIQNYKLSAKKWMSKILIPDIVQKYKQIHNQMNQYLMSFGMQYESQEPGCQQINYTQLYQMQNKNQIIQQFIVIEQFFRIPQYIAAYNYVKSRILYLSNNDNIIPDKIEGHPSDNQIIFHIFFRCLLNVTNRTDLFFISNYHNTETQQQQSEKAPGIYFKQMRNDEFCLQIEGKIFQVEAGQWNAYSCIALWCIYAKKMYGGLVYGYDFNKLISRIMY